MILKDILDFEKKYKNVEPAIPKNLAASVAL